MRLEREAALGMCCAVWGTEQCGAGDGVVLYLPFSLAPQRGPQGQGAIDQNYGVVCTRLVRLHWWIAATVSNAQYELAPIETPGIWVTPGWLVGGLLCAIALNDEEASVEFVTEFFH